MDLLSLLLFIVQWGGMVAGICLYVTFALTAFPFWKAHSVGTVTVTQFMLAMMNAQDWSVYAFFKNSLEIYLCNGFGLVCSSFAILTYLYIARLEHKKLTTGQSSDRKSPFPSAVLISSLLSAVSLLKLIFVALLSADLIVVNDKGGLSNAITVSGYFAVFQASIMMAGPLDSIRWIIANRDSSPLPPLTVIVGLLNCSLWCAYGIVYKDLFVFFPNALSIFLLALQAALLLIYPRNKLNK